MAALKVFGGQHNKGGSNVRNIVSAASQKKAAELVGISVSELASYWAVTHNKLELEVALASPGTVFHASSTMGNDFVPWVDGKAKSR